MPKPPSTPVAETPNPYREARTAARCQACQRGDHRHHVFGRPQCTLLVQFWNEPPTWTDCTCEEKP